MSNKHDAKIFCFQSPSINIYKILNFRLELTCINDKYDMIVVLVFVTNNKSSYRYNISFDCPADPCGSIAPLKHPYSYFPNKLGGSNKRGGWKIC